MTTPRDNKGRFVPIDCPHFNCGGGRLRHQGNGLWCCDGLLDPGEECDLEACWFSHMDGQPYETHLSP